MTTALSIAISCALIFAVMWAATWMSLVDERNRREVDNVVKRFHHDMENYWYDEYKKLLHGRKVKK